MNVLLFSPDVVGHPRVYCRVIADALQKEDCRVFIAMGFSEQYPLEACSDLVPLIGLPQVSFVDLRLHSESGSGILTAQEIRTLQESHLITVTLFIEADKSKEQFTSIANGQSLPLLGRNLGIFANTADWIPGEDCFTGEPISLIAPSLRTTLGNIKRRILDRKQSAKYFYETLILQKNTLDEVWVKDERVTDQQSPRVFWMPEISRPVEPDSINLHDCTQETRALEEFLSTNKELEPVLYFGNAAYYKGYDLFLKFVESNEKLCALHPGLSYAADDLPHFQYDVEQLRASLKEQGRLFETNAYVDSDDMKQIYFSSIRVYLTMHRLVLSSSTMIQALEVGTPVVVPNRGLIGHRVTENGLGAVYEYESLSDLAEKADFLWSSDLSPYRENAKRFWLNFSDETVQNFFRQRIMKH